MGLPVTLHYLPICDNCVEAKIFSAGDLCSTSGCALFLHPMPDFPLSSPYALNPEAVAVVRAIEAMNAPIHGSINGINDMLTNIFEQLEDR